MEEIKKGLKDYDESKVDIYIAYLKSLKEEKGKDNKLVNWWFDKIPIDIFISRFKKVFETGLFIDGETVTLVYRKKLIVTYDYHAYKNKIILNYPETIFDFQVVFEEDTFSFKKESGKVIYSHTMAKPFENNKKIVGAYGIIKNTRGEFIEVLNMETITKMKNTSTMKSIWEAWEDRMVLKSVIKRICNIHFKDITEKMDVIDNESNEPERATISELIQKEIEEAGTEEELTKVYKANIEGVEDKKAFIQLCSDRKSEILTV